MSKENRDIPTTENRNPHSLNLDQMETREIVDLINRENSRVPSAVAGEAEKIARAVDLIYERMLREGRLFYVGAGTSGRLGVLDAVECIPTFNIEEGRLVAIIAGGPEAMFVSQENVEDNRELGKSELEKYALTEVDSVLGIAASGRTPFVLGALEYAREIGSLTIGLACNKGVPIEEEVELAITPLVGPEVLTGSTRMKAGTAQKLVLNTISTTLMVRLGKAYSNLMVDLKPSNEKLRERAFRIFIEITGAEEQKARETLEKADYHLKEAIVMLEKDVDSTEAKRLLAEKKGILREVIG